MLRKIASCVALVAAVWVLAGLLQLLDRQLLWLLVGWTATGLLACTFVAIARLRRDLDELADKSEEGLTRCGRSINQLYDSRARHTGAIERLIRVSSSHTDRLDSHAEILTREQVRRAKLVRVVQSHQITLDVVGLALGVKNPRPDEEKGAPN